MELVNELFDLKCLQHKLSLISLGYQNLVDFPMDYFIVYYVVINRFSEVIWSTISLHVWFLKNIF